MGYKRVVITRPGGADTLQVIEEDNLPQPRHNEARVRVLAAGVARADILMRRGRYPGKVPPLPYVPGYDIVGRVDGLDQPHAGLRPGQMVAALTKVGGYSEYLCLPVEDLVPVPEGLDPAEVVCLVLNYLTAYQMMHRFASVQPGQQVLVHAAASGVGTALLQLGALSRLRVFGTASTSKLEILEKLGAQAIDYTRKDPLHEIRQETESGVDVTFDPIGGSHLWSSYQTLAPTGFLVAYGELSTVGTEKPKLKDVWMHAALPIVLKWISGKRTVRWYENYPFNKAHPDWYHEDLGQLISLLAGGQIQPIIAERLPLIQAARAHELLESRKVIGKIVLLCNKPDTERS